MKTDKLKKKIEMKGMLESEIGEEMEKLAEMAKDILIDNDKIFNSSSLKPLITLNSIIFQLKCELEYLTLEKLNDVLKPNKIILEGGGNTSVFTSSVSKSYINLKLIYGENTIEG